MVSPESWPTIDRALFAPRSLSWAESVMALFRDLRIRVQGRMWRGQCEARVCALALVHQQAHPVGPVARPEPALRPDRWTMARALRAVAELETHDL